MHHSFIPLLQNRPLYLSIGAAKKTATSRGDGRKSDPALAVSSNQQSGDQMEGERASQKGWTERQPPSPGSSELTARWFLSRLLRRGAHWLSGAARNQLSSVTALPGHPRIWTAATCRQQLLQQRILLSKLGRSSLFFFFLQNSRPNMKVAVYQEVCFFALRRGGAGRTQPCRLPDWLRRSRQTASCGEGGGEWPRRGGGRRSHLELAKFPGASAKRAGKVWFGVTREGGMGGDCQAEAFE